MCCHADGSQHGPWGLRSALQTCVSADVNVAATTVVSLFGQGPDQWQAAQRPSITTQERL